MIKNIGITSKLYDNVFFGIIVEHGMKDGIIEYCKAAHPQIDYPFVSVFSLMNMAQYTNEIRLQIMEKYIVKMLDDIDCIRDLFRESCKYFDVQVVESKFMFYGKKYGFTIPELVGKREVNSNNQDISIDYYLQEIVDELEGVLDSIDDYLEAKKEGSSQSYCLDLIQDIRGKLFSICNHKIERIFDFSINASSNKVQEIKDLLDEISYTKEFNIKESEQYKRLFNL